MVVKQPSPLKADEKEEANEELKLESISEKSGELKLESISEKSGEESDIENSRKIIVKVS